jgi:hypothetical protein
MVHEAAAQCPLSAKKERAASLRSIRVKGWVPSAQSVFLALAPAFNFKFGLQFVVCRRCSTCGSENRRAAGLPQGPHDGVYRYLCGRRTDEATRYDNFGSKRSPVAYPAFSKPEKQTSFAIRQRLRGKGELCFRLSHRRVWANLKLRTYGKAEYMNFIG